MDWGDGWAARREGLGCPMCDQGRPEISRSGSIRFFSTDQVDAYLCRRVAQRGYAQVIWRSRHAGDLTDLTSEEAAAFNDAVVFVAKAIRDHFGATLVNIQVLCNSVPHLHAHVSARYLDGDVNPTAPLPLADRDLPEEDLAADAAALTKLLGVS